MSVRNNHDVSGILAVPGAASTPAFMASTFPFIDAALDHRTLGLDDIVSALIEAQPTIMVGVSIGAHVCVEAATVMPSVKGLVLVAPAWIDEPDPRHAAMAHQVAGVGVREHLRTLPRSPAWLHRTTVESWSSYEPQTLLAHLVAVSHRPGPGVEALARIQVPTVLISFWDDPVHPWSVTQQWARALGNRRLIGLPLHALDRDPDVLGALASANLRDRIGALLPDGNLDRGRR